MICLSSAPWKVFIGRELTHLEQPGARSTFKHKDRYELLENLANVFKACENRKCFLKNVFVTDDWLIVKLEEGIQTDYTYARATRHCMSATLYLSCMYVKLEYVTYNGLQTDWVECESFDEWKWKVYKCMFFLLGSKLFLRTSCLCLEGCRMMLKINLSE